MKKLGVIVNHTNPRAAEALKRCVGHAERLGLELFADAATCRLYGESHLRSVENVRCFAGLVELVVVLGGDGTLLQALPELLGTKLPLMGFNIGSLGYLTCVDEQHFGEALGALREDQVSISQRMTLSATVTRADDTEVDVGQPALNDVVVARGETARLVHIAVSINGQELTTYVCDGVIVATATGSTAYSLSAGGPIVLPEMEVLTLSVICPHSLTARPLVMPSCSRLELHCVKSAGNILLALDGRESLDLEVGDRVVVQRGAECARIAFLKGLNPFDILNAKLGWSGTLAARKK